MAEIAIRQVRKSYGRTEVVHGVDLDIAGAGEVAGATDLVHGGVDEDVGDDEAEDEDEDGAGRWRR